MLRLLKKIVLVLVGISVLGLIGYSLRPIPPTVEVQAISRAPLVVALEEEGRTRIRHRFLVHAPLRGRLHRLELEVGDAVEKGQILGRLDPIAQEAAIAEARASIGEWRAQIEGVDTMRPKSESLEQARLQVDVARGRVEESRSQYLRAQSALEQARLDRERLEKLVPNSAAPRSQLDDARTAEAMRSQDAEAARQRVQIAELLVSVAEAAVATLESERNDPDYLLQVYQSRIQAIEARLQLLADERARTDIESPIAGRVLRLLEQSERFVEAGTPLLELGDTSDLEVVIDVLTTDAVRIERGAPIEFSYGGTEPLAGRVRLIEPGAFTKVSALGVEEQRVNVLADLEKPSDALGDGYRVDARILLWEGESVLQVPIASLFRDKGRWALFVVAGDTLERRHVEIGHRGDDAVEILEGLAEGDEVVLHPTADLEAGIEVRVQR